ncbi:hypothetical protein [Virgibacillus alimentarius]|uniref:CBS domain containing-hemolysin-like protein n=1 Tax=Virgibacillus alimentarius TaxID=698769 RepID=A0ABS4S4P2_9BACI|nr:MULTISPECIES: hypothetical protein [Virgibacillus]MBP2256466.1 CBS domain containing-hemolysin-like protein [Virgibacillus alimentarius]HLR66411.1 hypothetical protein [Virgibacillus sp.]
MNSKIKRSIKFSFTIAVITFVLAAIFSIISSSLLNEVVWIIGLIIVFIIVFIGIVFDMLGIAATSASEAPLHAMAAEKVKGSKEGIIIIRNADRFASFCNDVIGDISGIISGTASAIVVLQIANLFEKGEGSFLQIALNVFITSLVAALTVGGKALGKFFAVNASTDIIIITGKIISFIEKKLKIKILPRNN